jgi:ankyrin repeat protein
MNYIDLYDAIVFDGDSDKAIAIIKAGEVDINEPDEEGNTLIYQAELAGLDDVVQALIAAGAKQ